MKMENQKTKSYQILWAMVILRWQYWGLAKVGWEQEWVNSGILANKSPQKWDFNALAKN